MKTPLHNLCRIIDDENTERAMDKIFLCCNMLSPLHDELSLPILHAGITSVTKPRHFNLLIDALMNKNGLEGDFGSVTTKVTDQWDRTLVQAAVDNVLSSTNRHARALLQMLMYSSVKNNTKNLEDEHKVVLASFRDYKHNRLPIHYACESGLPWSEGLEDILDAYPALEEVDEVTFLFPFMLAACSPSPLPEMHSSASPRPQQSLPDLTAIYCLLRKNPMASCSHL